MPAHNGSFQLYSTCPQSKDVNAADYLRTVGEHARWSEEAGCVGMLVYTDNGLVDPWLVAQSVLLSTESLAPLVAVQPVYMHPYTAAKMVASLGFLHGRKVALNMLAGGFKNDLLALGDVTPHDERYERTVEYTHILRRLLEDDARVTADGKHYRVDKLSMAVPLPPELRPEILISGSSDAGMRAAEAIGATAIRYPKPADEEIEAGDVSTVPLGIRVGIIARADADEAWRIAVERFPDTRHGAIMHRVAMSVSDSVWHKELSGLSDRPDGSQSPYWLGPFHHYKTFCPYLVGSYEEVGHELARYLSKGYRTVILDIVPSAEEYDHIRAAFDVAARAMVDG
ncbi:LLM class flavin-dependent oxidoreductase [Azospirillum sp. sgz302134]